MARFTEKQFLENFQCVPQVCPQTTLSGFAQAASTVDIEA